MNCYDVTNQQLGTIRLVYCVKSGDTLKNICELYDVSVIRVLKENPLLTKTEIVISGRPRDKFGNLIYPGDRIYLPGAQVVIRDRRKSQRRKGERRENFDFHDGRRKPKYDRRQT